jgi:DNA replication protein DnaC
MSDDPVRPIRDDVHRVVDRLKAMAAELPEPTPQEIAAREAARRAAEWEKRAVGWGIPARLRDAAFDAGRPSKAIAAVQAYLETDYPKGRALILLGDTGLGKSWAAVAACRALHVRGEPWAFAYFPDWCRRMLTPETRGEATEQAQGTGLLVWDDFGSEYLKAGGFIETALDAVIWHREGNFHPLLLTTNLTRDQLAERVSDRVVDRLRTWGRLIAVKGPSLRRVE